MNIYEKIIDWLKIVCPFSDWVYFNVTNMEVDTNSVYSVSGTTVLNDYIDGSTDNELIFGISLVRQYSNEMSMDNLDVMSEIGLIIEAIEESDTLPELDERYVVDIVDIVQDVPSVNIYQDQNVCEYQIQAKIKYLKKAG